VKPRVQHFGDVIPAQTVNNATPGDIPYCGNIGVSVVLPEVRTARTGLLVMIHGLGSDWDEHDDTARDWADRFDLICIQVRDRHAGPRGLEIPVDLGKYQTIDVLRACQWAVRRFAPDLRRIFIWGGSGGGHMGLMATIMAPNLFAGAVICAPFTHPTFPGDIPEEWQDGWIRRCIPDGPVPQCEILVRSPLELHQHIRTPIVLIHGDKDNVVSCEHSRRLANKLFGTPGKFLYVELEGADHDFFGGRSGCDSRKVASETLAGDMLNGKADENGRFPVSEVLACGWCCELQDDEWLYLRLEPSIQ